MNHKETLFSAKNRQLWSLEQENNPVLVQILVYSARVPAKN